MLLADLRQGLQERSQLTQLLLDPLQLRLQLPVFILQLSQPGALFGTRPPSRLPVVGLPAGATALSQPAILCKVGFIDCALQGLGRCHFTSHSEVTHDKEMPSRLYRGVLPTSMTGKPYG